MTVNPEPSHGPSLSAERRRSARLDVFGQLNVHVVTRPMAVTLREISDGGFSIETTERIAVGTVYRFRFHLDGGEASIAVDATSVHSIRVSTLLSQPAFFTGFDFGRQPAETRAALRNLVATVEATYGT